jgi:zinc/manganese transport system substrate-binding protein
VIRTSLRPVVASSLALAAAIVLGGCGGSGRPAAGGHGRFLVVAAESFWGSIAGELAGDRAQVASVIADPATDPHAYTPTTADTRLLAASRMAIVNGIGYDVWADQALAANPAGGRLVLNVGRLLGLTGGANPHQWYSPTGVAAVADAIVRDYQALDPSDAGYFAARGKSFLTRSLAGYNRLRAAIRARFAGVPVGYSESIFAPLGSDLRLRLATPAGFARAIAEGTDVTAQDTQTVDRQAQTREIAVWVFNRQNVTPDVQRVNAIARAQRIPIVSVTETLAPQGASFEQWQSAQLAALLAALHTATGR